jgi:hypothetical protein
MSEYEMNESAEDNPVVECPTCGQPTTALWLMSIEVEAHRRAREARRASAGEEEWGPWCEDDEPPAP